MNIKQFKIEDGLGMLLVDGVWHTEYTSSSRWIFRLSDGHGGYVIIKVGESYQCEQEAEIYNTLDGEDKQYFPEVYGEGKVKAAFCADEDRSDTMAYVIMEWIELNRRAHPLNYTLRMLDKLAVKYGLTDIEECEYNSALGNWGISTSGQLFIVDYGF